MTRSLFPFHLQRFAFWETFFRPFYKESLESHVTYSQSFELTLFSSSLSRKVCASVELLLTYLSFFTSMLSFYYILVYELNCRTGVRTSSQINTRSFASTRHMWLSHFDRSLFTKSMQSCLRLPNVQSFKKSFSGDSRLFHSTAEPALTWQSISYDQVVVLP